MAEESGFDENFAFGFDAPSLAQELGNLDDVPQAPPKRKRGRPRKDEPKRVPFRTAAALTGRPKFEFVNISNADEAPSAETRRTIRKQAMLHHLRKRQAKTHSAQNATGDAQQVISSLLTEQPSLSPFDSPWLFPNTDDTFRSSSYFEELRGHLIYYFRPIRRMNPMFLASILVDPARVYHIFSNLDAVKDRPASATSVVLKQQLIQKINRSLTDPVQAVSIENLTAVLSIRIGSNVYEWGTRKEAEAHSQGLNKMIMHRGGLSTLSGNIAEIFIQKTIIMSDHILAATNVRPPAFPTSTLIDQASTVGPIDLMAECPYYCPPDREPFSSAVLSPLCSLETYELLCTLHAYIHDFADSSLRPVHRSRLIQLTVHKLPPATATSIDDNHTHKESTSGSSQPPKASSIRDSIYSCVRYCTLIILHISSLRLPFRDAVSTIPPFYAAELKKTLKTTSLWFFWDDLFFLNWWSCIVGAAATSGREEYPYFIANAAHASYQIMADDHLFFGAVMALKRAVWFLQLCEKIGPKTKDEEVGYGKLDALIKVTGLATDRLKPGDEVQSMHNRVPRPW